MRINKGSAKNFVILTFFILLTVLVVLNEAAGASITATEEWAVLYDSETGQREEARHSTTDASGNVYVTGSSYYKNSSINVYYQPITVKYDQDGTQLWIAKGSLPESNFIPFKVAVDGNGDVFVVGRLFSGPYGNALGLVKYNSAGEEKWAVTYAGFDWASDLALYDAGGGVTEIIILGRLSNNFTTVKYDTDGTQLWSSVYDGGATDSPQAMAVDSTGNIYVVGSAYFTSPTAEYYCTTVKYNSAGQEQWVETYSANIGVSNSGRDVLVDSGGNIIVTGTTATIKYDADGTALWTLPNASGYYYYYLDQDAIGNIYVYGNLEGDLALTKLSSAGASLWTKLYDGVYFGEERPKGIVANSSGGAYVIATSQADSTVMVDYLTVKFDTDGNVLWAKRMEGAGGDDDIPNSISLSVNSGDGLTYVLVSGTSRDNFTTISYANPTGIEQWTAQFDRIDSGNAQAHDVAVDGSGNVYISGEVEADETYGDYGFTAYQVVKYDSSGTELWNAIYPEAPGGYEYNNKAFAVDVDLAGNVFVTGESNGINTAENVAIGSCATVMYDTDGVFQWASTYDGGKSAACFDIAVYEDSSDGQTYAYVASTSINVDSHLQFAVLKYSSAGALVWERTYSFIGSSDYNNFAYSFHLDANGTAYIGGQSETGNFNTATVMAFAKDGTELWENPGYSLYVGADANFEALVADANGNVYAAGNGEYTYWLDGRSHTRSDLIVVKYDATGTELWAQRYGEVPEWEHAVAIVVDALGNSYVGGRGRGAVYDSGYGFVVIKYNAAGQQQWVRSFDGGGLLTDMLLDSAGNLVVTGSSSSYVTIAYDSAGNQLWFERYPGEEYGGEMSPRAMASDGADNIYVTGITSSTETINDMALIKYSQAEITSDTVVPTIQSYSPADGATGVAYGTDVIATFSEAMDPVKMNDPAAFIVFDTLTGEKLGTDYNVSYDEATDTITFDYYFSYETMYTAALTPVATDLAGNPLEAFSWSFTMLPEPDRTAPEFVSGSPTNGATGVITVPYISATFNEPMSPYSFTNSWFNPDFGGGSDGSFKLVNNSTGFEVIALSSQLTSYDEATMTATLYLEAPLDLNTMYTVTLVGSMIKDVSSNRLGTDVSWFFTTGSLGDTTAPLVNTVFPDVDATDVAADILYITATFSETMKADTFTTDQFVDLFTVTETTTGTPVNGFFEQVAGNTAYFYMFEPLTLGMEYTATIDAAVTDISGNALGTDYAWTFSTGAGTPSDDVTPPQVASVTPDGSALMPPGIGLLTVTFSERMDATTIEGVSDGSGSNAPFIVMVSGGAYITGTVVYDSGARTARFYPDTNLDYDTTYEATMRGVVTDVSGNPLGSDHMWSFTTSGDPGALGCDVDAGILAGCDNFDEFSYGTGVLVNTYTTSSTGPTSEGARRKLVANNKAFSTDEYSTDNIESEASAYADSAKLRMEARARDINVSSERDGAASYVATKVDVTGAPPGTLIPMTVTISASTLGDGYSAELQAHDFDDRPLGTIIVRKGLQQITRMRDLYGDSADPLNYAKDSRSDTSVMTFDLLYPAVPNNGVFLYFGAGAKKTTDSSGAVESDFIATLEFNPPPGVTVTLATGQSVTGEIDTDGDGVADSEDASDSDASVATMDTPTGTGQVEVAIDSSSGTGATLSQCESLDDSDISLNQTNKPGDHAFPDGIVSFNVNGLPLGGTAVVTVTFPTSIPAGSKYYKVNADGFYEFLSGAVVSTNTVTLTLVDGGQGDHDGIENGVIDDPGGIAVPQTCTAEIWYDGINQSCKTRSDYDQDGDGFDLEVDCDDTDDTINYGETEIWYDGINQSCKDGSDYDQDSDGHDSIAHGGDDCDDTDPTRIQSCIVDRIFENSFE